MIGGLIAFFAVVALWLLLLVIGIRPWVAGFKRYRERRRLKRTR